MKNFFQKFIAIASLSFLVFVLAGCSQGDEAKNVREYNNIIIATQQEMLLRGSEGSLHLSGQELRLKNTIAEFEKIQRDVQEEYGRFNAVSVPKGGEELAASMKRFFEVEIHGIQNILQKLNALLGNEADSKAVDDLMGALNDFSRDENNALADFEQVQRNTAAKYNEKVN